jgi:cyclohexyl-isocyanide hydratase
MTVTEIFSSQLAEYKSFLLQGLLTDSENFRIAPQDDENEGFPTTDLADSFTLGAYHDGQLAGIISFERDGKNRRKLRHKGILFRMYVAAAYRGQGVSKALINALLERVRVLGDVEQVTLTVIATNDVAKALYTRFGFETFAVEPKAIKWDGKYFEEEQMKLIL